GCKTMFAVKCKGEFRPRTVPSCYQHCFRMSRREEFERRQDQILTFARLKLAAGENEEAVTEHPAARRGMKQRGIDPLRHKRGVIDAAAAQNVGVPARSGDDQLEFVGARPCFRVEFSVFEEYRSDVRICFDALAGGTGTAAQCIADSMDH